MLLVLQKCRVLKLHFASLVFILTYAALIFDLEIFIRSFLSICITPVFKLMLNISAKIVVEGVKREKTALFEAYLPY